MLSFFSKPKPECAQTKRVVTPLLAAMILVLSPGLLQAVPPGVDELLDQAQTAQMKRQFALALNLADKAVDAAPTNPQCYYVRGRIHSAAGTGLKAVGDFGEALRLQPKAAEIYQLRGLEQFRLGHFSEALADFEAYVKFTPAQAPYHWQRGIACYYVGRYEEGARQFERYHSINTNTVEAALWHFFCRAKMEGQEKARATLLPGHNETRVPLTALFEFLAGRITPEKVLAEAKSRTATGVPVEEQLFLANYYLGVFYDATGDPVRARQHMTEAAENTTQHHLLAEAARVHARRLLTDTPPTPKAPTGRAR